MKWYLHNKPARIDSQYQWTVNASGFAVSSDYGATWSAGFDAEGNAVFNSLAANIIKAMQIYAGTLTFGEDTTTTLSDNADDTGALFQGDGTMEFQTKGQFFAQNQYQSGREANSVYMNADDSNNATLRLSNNLNGEPKMYANTLMLGKSGSNRSAHLENYQTSMDEKANRLTMQASATEHRTDLRNNYVGSSAMANSLVMISDSSNAKTYLQNATSGSNNLVSQLGLSSYDGEIGAALTVSGGGLTVICGLYVDQDGSIRIEAADTIHVHWNAGNGGTLVAGTLGVATISGKRVLTLE